MIDLPITCISARQPLNSVEGAGLTVSCRFRSAVVSDWPGSPEGSMHGRQTSNLVGDMLGQRLTPRWLGDPYGLDKQGRAVASPDRSNLPRIAAALGRSVPWSLPCPQAH